MKRLTALAIATALLLAASGPALAGDQLARTLGVEGEGYSNAELTQLLGAVEDNNRAQVNYIKLVHANGATTLSNADQLAQSLGVDAAEYTVAELIALKAAVEEGNATAVRSITSHATQDATYHPDAWQQLGASEGIDASGSSAAEITSAHSS